MDRLDRIEKAIGMLANYLNEVLPRSEQGRERPLGQRAIGEAQRRQGVPRQLIKHERRRICE